ncbi:hypothetical protein B4064_3340 [Caldibacillus thermoamylovorans]|uniref:Uncharacterized protein n=1 Tax=Caldibacillus thermoamylovorans TaxID=35841 RepID=A0A0D0G950_9BACI|nr:hypothetical protein B4064_3340 [Caldibacillus thermoamylovorans]KIO63925.1 hypothetical protein B4065_2873 [Caldibacillus thermoamylovorans]KIO68586.1 hypothetical protein B4166_2082 [Caldibacillus thermoamylovorans]KIO73752.1 hypothetical protein B4167_1877 [Caldibacillus thermoamylovorans]
MDHSIDQQPDNENNETKKRMNCFSWRILGDYIYPRGK